MRRQLIAAFCAGEHDVRITPLQRVELRTVADDDLRARQAQRQKRADILLDGDPTHVHEYRPRPAIERLGSRTKQLRIDAARPTNEPRESALLKLVVAQRASPP